MTELRSESRKRALISSTMLDLIEHRSAVVDACLRVGVEPLVLESFAADDAVSLARANELLNGADIYIGILAFRYGVVPPGEDKSITEIEYERAGARGIPRLMFLMSQEHPVRPTEVETGPGAEKLRAFKSLVRRQSVAAEFRSSDELKAAVVTGLVRVLDKQPRRPGTRTALLLLPFGTAHDELKLFISEELDRQGVRMLSVGEMFKPGSMWANAIAEAIQGTDLVIVDITSASPNIMYELGYVHALKKPTIILSDAAALRVPSYLTGFQVLTYDKGDLEPLRKPFERVLREHVNGGRR